MKTKLLYISIILVLTLSFSCSNSTSTDPSLGEFLYGTYVFAVVQYSPNPNGNPIYDAWSTESTYLSLNSDGSYTMRLELYVEQWDTIFNIYQKGSYLIKGSRYVPGSNFSSSYWKGTLEFIPDGQTVWEVDFSISKPARRLTFANNRNGQFLFELPNSGGYIYVWRWDRERPIY